MKKKRNQNVFKEPLKPRNRVFQWLLVFTLLLASIGMQA